jgi:hypothetical protein
MARCDRHPVILERFQAKWKPVRVKKTRQIKNLEPRFDFIETESALGGSRCNETPGLRISMVVLHAKIGNKRPFSTG